MDRCKEIKECLFSGTTSSGRVWRKAPESDARSVLLPLALMFFIFWLSTSIALDWRFIQRIIVHQNLSSQLQEQQSTAAPAAKQQQLQQNNNRISTTTTITSSAPVPPQQCFYEPSPLPSQQNPNNNKEISSWQQAEQLGHLSRNWEVVGSNRVSASNGLPTLRSEVTLQVLGRHRRSTLSGKWSVLQYFSSSSFLLL